MTPIPQMFYLSDILGKPVFDERNREVGVLRDVAVFVGPAFPALSKLRIRRGRHTHLAPWSQVMGMEGRNLIVRQDPAEAAPLELDERELLLYRNVLDKQMVDLSGRKVVRVNDVMLGVLEGTVRVTGVSIGLPAILRRLGFLRFFQRFPFLRLRDTVVPWESMVPLHYTDPTVQLNVQAERLSRLHTADLAAILSDMSLGERSRILDSLDDEMVADIIEEFEPNEQAEMLDAIDDERVPDVVGKMEPDDAADMLQVLSPEETADILLHMEEDEAADVRELMEHEPDSAGGIMTSEFIALSADLTVEEALAELREQALELPPENTYNIYLVDADLHLKGATNLRDVLMAPPTTPIADIMNDHPVHAHVDDDSRDAARLVARYDLLALPVLQDGHLAGIITVDDALDVLLPPEWKEYFPREQH